MASYKYRELPTFESEVVAEEEAGDLKQARNLQGVGQGVGEYEKLKALFEEANKLTDDDILKDSYQKARDFLRQKPGSKPGDLVKVGKSIYEELKFRHSVKLEDAQKRLRELEGPRNRWEQVLEGAGEATGKLGKLGLEGARAFAGSPVGEPVVDLGKKALGILGVLGRTTQGMKAGEMEYLKGEGYEPISREELAAAEARVEGLKSNWGDITTKKEGTFPFIAQEMQSREQPKIRMGGKRKEAVGVLDTLKSVPTVLSSGYEAAMGGISTDVQVQQKLEDLSKFYGDEAYRLATEEYGKGSPEELIVGRAKQIYATLLASDDMATAINHPQLSQLGYEIVGDVLPINVPGAAIKATKLAAKGGVGVARKLAPEAVAGAEELAGAGLGAVRKAGYHVFSRDPHLAGLEDLGEIGAQIGAVGRAARDAGQVSEEGAKALSQQIIVPLRKIKNAEGQAQLWRVADGTLPPESLSPKLRSIYEQYRAGIDEFFEVRRANGGMQDIRKGTVVEAQKIDKYAPHVKRSAMFSDDPAYQALEAEAVAAGFKDFEQLAMVMAGDPVERAAIRGVAKLEEVSETTRKLARFLYSEDEAVARSAWYRVKGQTGSEMARTEFGKFVPWEENLYNQASRRILKDVPAVGRAAELTDLADGMRDLGLSFEFGEPLTKAAARRLAKATSAVNKTEAEVARVTALHGGLLKQAAAYSDELEKIPGVGVSKVRGSVLREAQLANQAKALRKLTTQLPAEKRAMLTGLNKLYKKADDLVAAKGRLSSDIRKLQFEPAGVGPKTGSKELLAAKTAGPSKELRIINQQMVALQKELRAAEAAFTTGSDKISKQIVQTSHELINTKSMLGVRQAETGALMRAAKKSPELSGKLDTTVGFMRKVQSKLRVAQRRLAKRQEAFKIRQNDFLAARARRMDLVGFKKARTVVDAKGFARIVDPQTGVELAELSPEAAKEVTRLTTKPGMPFVPKRILWERHIAEQANMLFPAKVIGAGKEASAKAFAKVVGATWKQTGAPAMSIWRNGVLVLGGGQRYAFMNVTDNLARSFTAGGVSTLNPRLHMQTWRIVTHNMRNKSSSLLTKPIVLRDGTKITEGAVLDMLRKHGLIGQGRLKVGADMSSRGGWGLLNPLVATAKGVETVSKPLWALVGAFDDAMKAITFLNVVKKWSPSGIAEAVELTSKQAGNFRRISQIESTFFKQVMPFYVWDKYSKPFWLKTFIKNPERLVPFERAREHAEKYFGDSSGWNADIPAYARYTGFTAPEEQQMGIPPGSFSVFRFDQPNAVLSDLASFSGESSMMPAPFVYMGLRLWLGYDPITKQRIPEGETFWPSLADAQLQQGAKISRIRHMLLTSPYEQGHGLGRVLYNIFGKPSDPLLTIAQTYWDAGEYDHAISIGKRFGVSRSLGLPELGVVHFLQSLGYDVDVQSLGSPIFPTYNVDLSGNVAREARGAAQQPKGMQRLFKE